MHQFVAPLLQQVQQRLVPPAARAAEVHVVPTTDIPAPPFRLGTDIRVPSGTKARIQANLAAIDEHLERLLAEHLLQGLRQTFDATNGQDLRDFSARWSRCA